MAPPAATKKGSKTESAPPIDKLLLPAIGIGLALLAYQFFKGIKAEIPRVNLLDETEMRQVFFGEGGEGVNSDKSYCVLCHDESSTLPLSSVFLDAYTEKKSPAEFRVVDCNFVLPSSEKTIAERFKLDLTKRPTIFVSGKVGEPKQIPIKHLKTGKMLTKVLRNLLERRAAKIETTQELRTKCLDKDICGLLLKGSKQAPSYVKSAMNKLLEEFPTVAFGFVDSTVEYVMNAEEFLPEYKDEQPRFVVFRKVSGGTGAADSKERLKTSLAALPTNGVAYGPMSNLVASVVQQTAVMTKVPVLPVIKTRTKKLEHEERNKRARKLEQQRRQAEGRSGRTTTGSGDGSFSEANDGSRDGRRAERERRRAEHMAQHNVKPKTPEEIAELERQRRIRMDEEAAKWNVAPEDAPEEGEAVHDDEYTLDDIMGDEEGESGGSSERKTRDQHDHDEEDNGEDVMDLD